MLRNLVLMLIILLLSGFNNTAFAVVFIQPDGSLLPEITLSGDDGGQDNGKEW